MAGKRNDKIKKADQETEFTPEQVLELQKCMADPIYFAKTYVKIQHPTRGAIDFNMYDYQEVMMRNFMDNRYNIILSARQTGKSITSAIYLLWFAIFHFDKNILIASNKEKGAKEMIRRIRYAYEYLPIWLKPGVTDDGWNKFSIVFDNDSRIDSTATSEDSGRGDSLSLLYLDEFAFVKDNIQDEFWTSILPTLSTGGGCIMSSTPNGDSDLFATLWRAAKVGKGMEFEDEETGVVENLTFTPMHIEWDAPPGRDNKFRLQQIALIGEQKWRQEYLCEFLSSDALLIDPIVLAQMTLIIDNTKPEFEIKGVKFYKQILNQETYLIGMDPATGTGEDFSVIEVFHFPSMEQVAEYRSNSMSSPQMYTMLKNIIKYLEQRNCTVYFSVENNGVGEGIISLFEADEDPPVMSEFVSEDGAKRRGMYTTNKSKMRACLNVKEMIEKGNIKINSKILLQELKTYTRKGVSYSAQRGSTDDCISGVLINIRILEEIATYDQAAHDKLYSIDNEDDWGDGEIGGDDDEPMPMIM